MNGSRQYSELVYPPASTKRWNSVVGHLVPVDEEVAGVLGRQVLDAGHVDALGVLSGLHLRPRRRRPDHLRGNVARLPQVVAASVADEKPAPIEIVDGLMSIGLDPHAQHTVDKGDVVERGRTEQLPLVVRSRVGHGEHTRAGRVRGDGHTVREAISKLLEDRIVRDDDSGLAAELVRMPPTEVAVAGGCIQDPLDLGEGLLSGPTLPARPVAEPDDQQDNGEDQQERWDRNLRSPDQIHDAGRLGGRARDSADLGLELGKVLPQLVRRWVPVVGRPPQTARDDLSELGWQLVVDLDRRRRLGGQNRR